MTRAIGRWIVPVILCNALCLVPTFAQDASDQQPGEVGGDVAQGTPGPDDAVPAPEAMPPPLQTGWKISLFPAVFSTPETGFGGGAGAIVTHRRSTSPDDRPQSLPVMVIYTEKDQMSAAFIPELYFGHDAWQLRLELTYMDFPSDFYGIGHNTPRSARESYTIEETRIAPGILRRIRPGFWLGVSYDWQKVRLRRMEADGQLDRGLVLGHEGGRQSGLGPVAIWDTRDNSFFPGRGWLGQAGARFYRDALGTEYEYEAYGLDLRRYLRLYPRLVLALQCLALLREGQVPFGEMARLGESLRGIYAERYVDRALLMAQLELRFPIWRRFGGVIFAGAGDVARRMSDYRLGEAKIAGGAGLRFAADPGEQINLRVDVGVGDEETQVYFQLLEAF